MQNGGVQNGGLLNGSAQNGGPALLSSGFRRAEVVRLMQQCLEDLGYSRTAQVLEKDSGIKCLSKPVFRFREAVLGGDWWANTPRRPNPRSCSRGRQSLRGDLRGDTPGNDQGLGRRRDCACLPPRRPTAESFIDEFRLSESTSRRQR